MSENLERRVRRRARGRCEYCQMPVRFEPFRPHVDHIIAEQHGGKTHLSNLAFACAHCNSHKGTNITSIDSMTKRVAALFNPRTHRWSDHFAWHGPILEGKTPEARATIYILSINASRRVEARAALMEEGVY